ncbi:unnamed protein product [Protopolystoma xenopodis]|uniref:Uncharacterized protein n=1 Tax=Protopolystoma xenopodis TaxID=117903 RepID=A0A448X0S5_9PLAT|nr:unnamed protein product [Protopolystoma xenopodis]
MSTLRSLFGTKKNDKATSSQAMERLRSVQEMLVKKQDFLEKKIEKELLAVKTHGMANKRAALQALSRKKRYEQQLTKIDGTLTTIEFQIEALDNAGTNVEVMNAMRTASDALKAAHKNMKVDDVHDIMDEIQEQQEVADEISNAISRPAGINLDFDEDELLAELEALQVILLAFTLLISVFLVRD